MEQTKKYRVTFSKVIDSIDGTMISDETVVEVKLPKSLSHASSDAFSGCTSLEAITVTSKATKKKSQHFIDAEFNGTTVRFEGL